MSIVDELSSRIGDKTEAANRAVASRCIENPELLGEIADGIAGAGRDAAVLGDCAEVMTMAAEHKPEAVAPFADVILPLLAHQTTRVRWEGMHAIALIAEKIPDKLEKLLPRIRELLRSDSSTIVRDYAIDALGGYARTSAEAAAAAYPPLREALHAWDGKHAASVLSALAEVAGNAPELAVELLMYGHDYAEHPKPSVRKAAKALVKAAQK